MPDIQPDRPGRPVDRARGAGPVRATGGGLGRGVAGCGALAAGAGAWPVELAAIRGAVLKRTEVPEAWVLLSLAALAAAAWGLMRLRPSQARLFRWFAAISIVYLVLVTAVGLIHFDALEWLTWEDGVTEWIAANVLLVAWAMAAVLAIRGVCRGRPHPVAAFLATGLFLAWWRELTWGRPFIGRRLWYSRNLFRPGAYLGRRYFEGFRESQGLTEDPSVLYAAHLVTSGLLVVLLAALLVCLVRRRRAFLHGLRELPRRAYGRYFLAGVGAYVGAQIVGTVTEAVYKATATADFRAGRGALGHRIVDEPIELWAAACLLISVLVLWRDSHTQPADGETAGR